MAYFCESQLMPNNYSHFNSIFPFFKYKCLSLSKRSKETDHLRLMGYILCKAPKHSNYNSLRNLTMTFLLLFYFWIHIITFPIFLLYVPIQYIFWMCFLYIHHWWNSSWQVLFLFYPLKRLSNIIIILPKLICHLEKIRTQKIKGLIYIMDTLKKVGIY